MARYLDYSKALLSKVSFCPNLLKKEYRKCKSYLSESEQSMLRSWLRTQQYGNELIEK